MRNYRPFVSATASRAVLLAAVSMLAVGCSSDVTRFDDPFSNPFSSKSASRGEERSYASAVPTTRVDSAPLGNDDIVTNSAGRPKSVVSRDNPFGSRPEPSYSTTSLPPPTVARPSVPATPAVNRMADVAAPVSTGKGGWSPVGGTTIQASGSDSVESLSKRYGVPASAIAQANGLTPGQKITAGQSLVIPTYSMALGTPTTSKPALPAPQTVAATPAPVLAPQKPVQVATTRSIPAPPPSVEASERGWTPGAQAVNAVKTPETKAVTVPVAAVSGKHVVNSGESLGGIAARYKVKRSDLAKANKLKVDENVRIGQTLIIPGQAQVAQAAAPAAKLVKTETVAPAKAVATKVETVKVETARLDAAKDKAKQVKTVAVKQGVDPVVTGSVPPQKLAAPVEEVKAKVEEPVKEAAGPRDPQFRWPVRGHVISRFGQSNGGAASEGIKLAVPEGTAVRAAEDGKVAYAGSDLKHLGNLVLVRHANGYVSVYAHNSEINVRPGDEVRRGQTIAKAGQSGNAASPQLYFELRKGKNPVDPMGYLGKE